MIVTVIIDISVCFRLAQETDKVIIAAPGYPEESSHYRNWILCSVKINDMILSSRPHFPFVNCRKSRKS